MAKYNYREISSEEVGWQVIRAVTQVLDAKDIDPENIDITLLVNGVEIDFVEFSSGYISNLDELIEARAREMARDRFDKLFQDVQYLRDQIDLVTRLWSQEE